MLKLAMNRLINIYENISDTERIKMLFITLNDIEVIGEKDIINMFRLYGERSFNFYTSAPGNYEDSSFGTMEFISLWETYVESNRDNWLSIIKVYNLEYNPIDNYDMTEIETFEHKGDNVRVTDNHADSDFTTNITTPNRTDLFVTSDENPSGRLSQYTSSTGASNTNGTQTGGGTTTETIAETEKNLRRHGNIGVTTSQQMVQKELDLRKFNLKTYIIKNFINEYTFMCADFSTRAESSWRYV